MSSPSHFDCTNLAEVCAHDYVGWIPCVSGTLFFELTSCGLGYRRLLDVNHLEVAPASERGQRHVMIASEVDWRDEPLDAKRHEMQDTNGRYLVMLLASMNAGDSKICGAIYLVPVDDRLDGLRNQIAEINQRVAHQEEIGEAGKVLSDALLADRMINVHVIDFTLDSAGFIGLSLRDANDITEITQQTLVRQAYYYAKYAWHKHQHHSYTAESLTTVHRNLGCRQALAESMILDLKRSLVRIKRDFFISDYRSLFQAEGIGVYAQSLILSCQCKGYLTPAASRVQATYFDHMAASLKVQAHTIEKELMARNLVSSNFRALLLFVLSLLAPLTLIYADEIRALITQPEGGGTARMPALLAAIYGSERHLFSVCLVGFVLYFGYRQAYLKYGAPLLGFLVFRRFLDRIVQDAYKAYILSWVIIGASLFLMLFGLYRVIQQ